MQQEDRYAQIERDNRLLLEKMSHIMRKGGVDNHNSTSKYAKSLNKEARKKELHKITTENQVCNGWLALDGSERLVPKHRRSYTQQVTMAPYIIAIRATVSSP